MKAQMHIDGCHFFAWVFENSQGGNELTWYERTGDDLMMHVNYDEDDCPRCVALMNGAKPREQSVTIELAEDAKLAFFEVLAKIGELDEGVIQGEAEDSSPLKEAREASD